MEAGEAVGTSKMGRRGGEEAQGGGVMAGRAPRWVGDGVERPGVGKRKGSGGVGARGEGKGGA